VLRPADDPAWRRWSAGWEAKTARLPAPRVAGAAAARSPLPPRAVVLGVEHGAASRAWPVDLLRRQPAVMDDLAGLGVVILTAEDGLSLRVFESTVDGRRVSFFARLAGGAGGAPVTRRWIDGVSGSEWDFQGRAVAGPWQGRQLRQLPAFQDYWFDWRRFHPATTLYGAGAGGAG
jgi:hypothetical protein